MEKNSKVRLLGKFSVDSGLVWFGDPCYILHKKEGELPESVGYDWQNFANQVGSSDFVSFKHDAGHNGFGVAVRTPGGDGTFPVLGIFNEENKIAFVVVDFSDTFNGQYDEDMDEKPTLPQAEPAKEKEVEREIDYTEVDPDKFTW